jgi:phosphoglycerate dehydrogenase-like enzyme
MKPFFLGLSRDLLNAQGKASFGDGPLELLNQQSHIQWEFMPESVREITPQIMARYDAIHISSPKVTAQSLAGDAQRVKLVSRHGVGYDSVDVRSLSQAGVITTNTPIAVRRPVAVAALSFIFALAGRLFTKDRLVREGRWLERNNHMGLGLTTRTLGIVGVGGIGKELLALAKPFGWRMLASDPHVAAPVIESLGAEKTDFDRLLAESDFVVATLILDEHTRHWFNASAFAAMKPQAFFINMARGGVVDEQALIQALEQKQIAGAGLDVFEQEPIASSNPLLSMEQVILTPHALCWTDECFDAIAREGLGNVIAFSRGERPASVVEANSSIPSSSSIKR